jgi:hypothetical protein
MIQTERANASISVSWYALLLPDPFGPATIQKVGRSMFAWGNVGHAENTLVLSPCLGDVLAENVSQALSEESLPPA